MTKVVIILQGVFVYITQVIMKIICNDVLLLRQESLMK